LFALCVLALGAAALAVRLPRLGLRPMHGDEANQAVKAGILLETGVYRYDPREHHGPILYWLTLPSLRLSGAADFAQTNEAMYRIVPVVLGAGLIVLLFLVADGLGRGPVIWAGLLAALSPAMVFYSRYYVQETLLVFFSFAAIACGWRWFRSQSMGWAVAAGTSLGLAHATKETWILAAAAMAAGVVLAALWTGKTPLAREAGEGQGVRARSYVAPLLAAAVSACVVSIAIYSSFGTDWQGPLDSILAYANYFRRGSETGIHDHPWFYYLELLTCFRPARGFFWTEGLIVGLAAVGLVSSLVRFSRFREGQSPAEPRRHADSAGSGPARQGPRPPDPVFCSFLAFYTLVLTVLYAAIPYKTPWCLLGFLHGMTMLAGVGAWAVIRVLPGRALKLLAGAILIAGAVHLGWESYWLNFRLYADQRNPYVYAHTSTDVLNLAAQVERLARVAPEGHDMTINVVTPENYWPLPWYLRRFNPDHVGYWDNVGDWSRQTAPYPPPCVILLTADIQPAVDARLRAGYAKQMIFGLRPGVLISVYVREDLWQAFIAAVQK
jgi:uncharacterized protein (TIGR03663 family)